MTAATTTKKDVFYNKNKLQVVGLYFYKKKNILEYNVTGRTDDDGEVLLIINLIFYA